MKKIILNSLSLLLCSIAFAQIPKKIALEEVLQSVEKNNLSLKISQQNVASAQADVTQSQAVFLPIVKASHTAMATTNPLMAFGSKLNQQILTAGDFDPNLLNNPSQIENFATKVEVFQPIFHLDGFYQNKAAQSKLAAQKLQTERGKQAMHLQTVNAYMQLQLAYKNVAVIKTVEKMILESVKITKDKLDQGLLQKADFLMVQIHANEIQNQLFQAENNVEKASAYLSFLMNEPTENRLVPKDELVKNTTISGIENKSANSTDIQAYETISEAYRLQYKSSLMSFLPQLDAFGSYELHDDTLFKAQADGYTFGAQLSWTLFEGNQRTGKIKKSKSEFEKAKLEAKNYAAQQKNEIENAKRYLKECENSESVTLLSVAQSKEAYRTRQNRFKEGLENSNDLLQAESLYLQKELAHSQALYQYNYALAYLQFLTK